MPMNRFSKFAAAGIAGLLLAGCGASMLPATDARTGDAFVRTAVPPATPAPSGDDADFASNSRARRGKDSVGAHPTKGSAAAADAAPSPSPSPTQSSH